MVVFYLEKASLFMNTSIKTTNIVHFSIKKKEAISF